LYAKVFRSLWDGSLRGQSDAQLVFVYMLAHSDSDGVVDIIAHKIADDTGLPIERVLEAVAFLEATDPSSRHPDEDGRRIAQLDAHRAWGWRIVNHAHFRELRNQFERQRQNRENQAAQRVRNASANVSTSQHQSALSANTDTEASTDTEPRTLVRCAPMRKVRDREPEAFPAWYDAFPRHVARRAAARAYRAALKRGASPEALLEAASRYRTESAGKDAVKHPATWLNGDCWLDEPETTATAPIGPGVATLQRMQKILAEKEAADASRART
jgi:hypothetical protein